MLLKADRKVCKSWRGRKEGVVVMISIQSMEHTTRTRNASPILLTTSYLEKSWGRSCSTIRRTAQRVILTTARWWWCTKTKSRKDGMVELRSKMRTCFQEFRLVNRHCRPTKGKCQLSGQHQGPRSLKLHKAKPSFNWKIKSWLQ